MFRTIYLTILILVLLQSSSPLNVPKEDPLAYELQTIDDALHWLSHDFTVKLLVLYDDRDVSSRTLRAAWPGILEVIAPILCAPAVVNLQSSIGKFLATTMSTEGVRVPTVRIYPAERVPRRHVPPTLNRLSGILKPSIEYTGGLSASGLRSAVVATYTDKHIVYTTSLIGLWEHLQSVSADLKDGTPPLYYLVLASNKNTSTDLFRVVSTRIRHAVRCIQVVITDKSARSSNKTANKKRVQESLEVAEGVLLHVFGASKLPLLNFFQLSTPLPEINWNQTEISVETLAAAFDHIPATSFTSQKSKISIETLLDFVLRNLPQEMDPVDGDSPDHRETEKRTVHSNTALGQRVQQFELTAITSRSRQTEKYLRHVAGQMQNGALYLPSQSLLYSWANNLFNEDVMGVAFLDPTTDEHSSILSTLSQLTREANRLSVQQVSRATHSVRRTADSSAGTRFRVRSYFWISTIGHVQLMNFFGGIESNSLVFIFPQKERFTLYAGALTMKDIISFLERIVANGLRSKEFSMGGLGEVCGREV